MGAGIVLVQTLQKHVERLCQTWPPAVRRKTCVQHMGVDVPHRRQAGVSSAYVLSLETVGPFVPGRDPGGEGTAKYCLVGTLPVPIQSAPEEPLAEAGDPPRVEPEGLDVVPKPDGVVLLGDEGVPVADEDEARKQMRDDMGEVMSLQNVSFVEMLPSRHTRDLLHGMNESHSGSGSLSRAYGPCEGPGYGRVESEINQFKRRLRVLLRTSGVDTEFWPCVARQVMKERRRSQLLRLGLPQPELLPFFAPVMVKVKRWHKAGALADPYKEVRLCGPSPLMTFGWLGTPRVRSNMLRLLSCPTACSVRGRRPPRRTSAASSRQAEVG